MLPSDVPALTDLEIAQLAPGERYVLAQRCQRSASAALRTEAFRLLNPRPIRALNTRQWRRLLRTGTDPFT